MCLLEQSERRYTLWEDSRALMLNARRETRDGGLILFDLLITNDLSGVFIYRVCVPLWPHLAKAPGGRHNR